MEKFKYLDKKASVYFKKTSKIPTASRYKKWKSDYKVYKIKREARERADTEKLFGKMTDEQWKKWQKR